MHGHDVEHFDFFASIVDEFDHAKFNDTAGERKNGLALLWYYTFYAYIKKRH